MTDESVLDVTEAAEGVENGGNDDNLTEEKVDTDEEVKDETDVEKNADSEVEKKIVKKKRKYIKKIAKRDKIEAVKESEFPPEELHLSMLQLKTIDWFEARVQLQGVVLENLDLKGDKISTEYRFQMNSLKAQRKRTQDSMLQIKDEHNKFIKEIEAEFGGISMKDYAIEPDGTMIYNPLPEGDG